MKWCDPGPAPTAHFSTVLARELEHIQRARTGQPAQELKRAEAAASAEEMNLKALAFSGGGIRSATFNLGILQALCEQRLLSSFDYLSTVSGGGYIGSWLSAQIQHRKSIRKVEDALSPTDAQAHPKADEDKSIEFLRQYSNYLTPRRGLLSIDTLTAVAAYVRNVLIIQSTLIALIVTILLLPRIFAVVIDALPAAAWEGAYFSRAGWTGLLLVVAALAGIWLNIRARPASFRARTPFVVWIVIVPAVLGAFALAVALSKATQFPWVPLVWFLVLAYAVVTAALALLPATHEHYVLVVRREAPWESAQAFVAAAKARPKGGKLRINSVGEDWESSSQGLLDNEIDAVVVPRSRQRGLRVDPEKLRVLPLAQGSALRQTDRDLWTRLREAFAIFAFGFVAGVCGLLLLSLLQTLMKAMND